jgi:hypothetical protein
MIVGSAPGTARVAPSHKESTMMATFVFDNIFVGPQQGCSIQRTTYVVERVGDTMGGWVVFLFIVLTSWNLVLRNGNNQHH